MYNSDSNSTLLHEFLKNIDMTAAGISFIAFCLFIMTIELGLLVHYNVSKGEQPVQKVEHRVPTEQLELIDP